MCENLISLTFKCLGILFFSSVWSFFKVCLLSLLPSAPLSPSLVPFLLSYLLKSPPHALHLPQTLKILRSFILHGGCRGQSSLNQFFSIFISHIHLPCPLPFLNSLVLIPTVIPFPLSFISPPLFPLIFP